MKSNNKISKKKKFILNCCFAKLWRGQKCICREIKIIQKYIYSWYKKLNQLESLLYKNDNITLPNNYKAALDKQMLTTGSEKKVAVNDLIQNAFSSCPITFPVFQFWAG